MTNGWLTPRDIEVLDLVKVGKRDREIGLELGISSQTVKNHVYLILRKLQARTRTEATIKAISEGHLQLAGPTAKPVRRRRKESRSRKEHNQKYWSDYYQEHRDEVLVKNRAWNIAHPKETKVIRDRYRAKHKAKVAAGGV